MKKRRVFEGLVVFLIVSFMISFVSAEKLEIKILDGKDNYSPGENINFKIIAYDDGFNKIEERVSFEIQNYYRDVIEQGELNSGEVVVYRVPENARVGFWGIKAIYGDISSEELFNVVELEKAEIKLEEDYLIVRNVGNVPYRKTLQITIGEHKETALVPLEVGQEKKIRLTAPEGQYLVKVSDGTEENSLVFSEVSLTGNVIGLERVVEGSFWMKYPMVGIFLVALALVTVVVTLLRTKKRYAG